MLAELGRDGFRLCEVVGQPGLGKTRLLGELRALARRSGYVALGGRATEFEQEMPLGPMVDALDDHLHERRAALLDRLDDDEARLLAAAFPGLTGAAGGDPVRTQDGLGRYRLFRSVRLALEVLAGPSGLILTIDDAHWADPTTIELLEYLLRHPPRGAVGLAVAYRPSQLPARLASVFAALAGGRDRRLELNPLTMDEAQALLGPDVTARACERLYRASGGNPFYLEALANAGNAVMRATHPLGGPGGSVPDLPPVVRAALGAEIDALTPQARHVVQTAAVVGTEFEPPLIAAVAGLTPAVVLDALDRLAARDLVRPVPGSGRLQFRHPLVRHVVYESSAPGWRLSAHAAAAAALARVGAPAVARAHHVERSAHYGDLDAIDTLVEAARSVAPARPAYRRAVAAGGAAAAARRPGRRRGHPAGAADERTGPQPGAQRTAGRRTGELPPGDAAAAEVGAHRTDPGDLGDGDPGPAGRPARGGPGAAGRRGRPVPAAAVTGRGAAAPATGHPEPADGRLGAGAGRAGPIDPDTCDRSSVPMVEAVRRTIDAFSGDLAVRTEDALQHVGDLIDSTDDGDLARQLDVVVWLCWADLLEGRPRQALRNFTRSVTLAQNTGQSYVLPSLLAGQSRAYGLVGDLAAARSSAEDAVEVARLLGSPEALAVALVMECWAHIQGGDGRAGGTGRVGSRRAGRGNGGWVLDDGPVRQRAGPGRGRGRGRRRGGVAERRGRPRTAVRRPHPRAAVRPGDGFR